jgi:hypothetical protein
MLRGMMKAEGMFVNWKGRTDSFIQTLRCAVHGLWLLGDDVTAIFSSCRWVLDGDATSLLFPVEFGLLSQWLRFVKIFKVTVLPRCLDLESGFHLHSRDAAPAFAGGGDMGGGEMGSIRGTSDGFCDSGNVADIPMGVGWGRGTTGMQGRMCGKEGGLT